MTVNTEHTKATTPTTGTPPRRSSSQTLSSVAIPCDNEEEVLPLMYNRLTAATVNWQADLNQLPA